MSTDYTRTGSVPTSYDSPPISQRTQPQDTDERVTESQRQKTDPVISVSDAASGGQLGLYGGGQAQDTTEGRIPYTSERALGEQYAQEGDVTSQPGGVASLGDKLIGKPEKVIGKYTNNPELQVRGELRETGGKAAVESWRAAYD